jgi:predicted nucleic acid-binding protein
VVLGAGARRPAFRIVIDVNVWVAHALGGSLESAASRIIDAARSLRTSEKPVQLAISLEMMDNVERVLVRRGVSDASAREFAQTVLDLVKTGPEKLDPYLLVSGRDQLAVSTREDAGVLATAISARANLLVTANLKDFVTNDGEVVETQVINAGSARRQLFAILHERADDLSLVVAHPVDALDWLNDRIEITPHSIRSRYAHRGRTR